LPINATVTPASNEDEAMLAVFVIWRRMLLTAIASHSENQHSPLARNRYIEGTVAMGGGDPMVTRIAMMKALYGHRPTAARAENGSNSRIKNLLMHCGWS
jgi:hypothetical protein